MNTNLQPAKTRLSRLAFVAASALLITALASCSLEPEEEGRVSYVNEELTLVDVTDASSYSRAAAQRSLSARAAAPGGARLTLVAEVEPPKDLQASHVFLEENGKYAFVAYMTQGDSVGGALDLIEIRGKNLEPRILSSIEFDDFDVAVVFEKGGTIYLGGHKTDQSSLGKHALVMKLRHRNGYIDQATELKKSLPGVFVTDMVLSGNSDLYVTTGASEDGSGVGVYKLSASDLTERTTAATGYPDLRSVALDASDNILVLDAGANASDAKLVRLNSSLQQTLAYSLSRDAQSEAKSKLALAKGRLFVALNTSGLLIANPADLTEQAFLPAPSLSGIPVENQATNAASFGFARDKDVVLIANGEAGLWVGDAADLAAATDSASAQAAISGTIRFGAGQSVNFADAKNGLVVAAVGTGGTKIVIMD